MAKSWLEIALVSRRRLNIELFSQQLQSAGSEGQIRSAKLDKTMAPKYNNDIAIKWEWFLTPILAPYEFREVVILCL